MQMNDDARGKPCPKCGEPMVSMSTVNGGERHCVGCGSIWNWPLDPGQQALLGNNRQTKKSRP